MEIHYPPGIKPRKTEAKPIPAVKKPRNLRVSAGNRGMDFEDAINKSNQYYAEKGLCLITKRPTPINIVKVDYSHGPKITDAYFETQSTTDYNGVYKGRYIDFEAKTTRLKTSFPLANIPVQQIDHLEKVVYHGGIAFFLIHWQHKSETYLVPAKYIIDFYRKKERASIPYDDMKANGFLVREGYRPPYDYLPVMEEVFLK